MTKRTPLRLTKRERDLLGLIAEGMSAKQAAASLGLSIWTAKSYLANARRRNNNTTGQLLNRFRVVPALMVGTEATTP